MPALDMHFDPAAICAQALQQDHGIIVSTNNPAGFRRIMYAHMRKVPEHKLTLRTDPQSPSRFLLLRQQEAHSDA